eukprot:gene12952-27325_t
MGKTMSKSNKTFLETHLGTDLLISAWLLFISCLLGFIVMCYDLIDALLGYHSLIYLVSKVILCLSGFMFTIAGYLFLLVSYEEDMMAAAVEIIKLENMSWCERYFVGNNLLMMAWLLVFSTLPIVIYPISAHRSGIINSETEITFLCAVLFAVLLLLLWAISCFPENLTKNNGKGSSYVHNLFESMFVCSNGPIVTDGSDRVTDFLIVSWTIAVASVLSIPFSILLVVHNIQPLPWLVLIADVFFAAGSVLFVYVLYPENAKASIVWYHFSGNEYKDKIMNEEECNAILGNNNITNNNNTTTTTNNNNNNNNTPLITNNV